MTSLVRTLASSLLLLVAVATALAGVAAQWTDRLARTPGPLQEILAPLATDERVHAAIADAMTESAAAQFPTLSGAFPGLEEQLNSLVEEAVAETMSGDGVAAAWDESVELSRVALVEELDALHAAGGDAPTVWLYLTPFVELGRQRLIDITPEPFTGLVNRIELSGDLKIALGRPDTQQAMLAADIVFVAQGWMWFHIAAIVLATVGLVIGSRRGRWLALLGASLAGVIALMLARRALIGLTVADEGSLAHAVGTTLLEGTVESLLGWTLPAVVAGWALVAVGGAGIALTARRP